MRTITIDIIREHGEGTPRLGIKLDDHRSYDTFLDPEDVGPWLQGFIAALPPLED